MQRQTLNEAPLNLLPHDGDVAFYPGFFTVKESDAHFAALLKDISWKQEPITIFGKQVMQPRLTAWYGDDDKSYTYSGIKMLPSSWCKPLLVIKRKIEPVAGTRFTSALLNRYRNGQDSMGWHRDNEKELGKNPIIASVSFGTERIFQFRNYKQKAEKISLTLQHGSLLIMRGETNNYWEHQLPKTKAVTEERINLTFRVIS